MAGSISWKEFESIVARLQRSFAAGGQVTLNDKLPGRNSGKKRQIDVSVRADVGGEEVLIIVECKKWNRKADVKAVEAFAGVKEDVGANLGIMVSIKGFTTAARKTAATKGINLYRYEDTLTPGWPSGLETNVLLEIWELTPTVARLSLRDGSEEEIVTDEDLDLTDTRTGETGPLATIVRKIWDQLKPEERFERSWTYEFNCSCPERPEIVKMTIGATSKRIRGYRTGRLQFEGFVDDAKGHARVESWKMIFAGEFIPIPEQLQPPRSETYSILMRTTHVRTEDPKSEGVMKFVYDGILELTVKNKSFGHVPIRSDSAAAPPRL